jgi:hypothetical protein
MAAEFVGRLAGVIMPRTVLVCARLFDGSSDTLAGPTEILIENGVVAEIAPAVGRPA